MKKGAIIPKRYSFFIIFGEYTPMIYIYFNVRMAFCIPSHNFENKTQRDELIQFLRGKVDGEKFVAM